MLRAKKHSVLADITAGAVGRRLTETVEFIGHRYTLKSLTPRLSDWVNEQGLRGSAGTITGFSLAARKPRVAAALAAVDDVPVEQVFALPEAVTDDDKATLAGILADPIRLENWRRDEILLWLGSDECDEALVEALSDGYHKIVQRERAALEALAKDAPSPLANSTPSKT